ncbi:unnamed protein product, partial [Ectocarpus sp. 12 AP-2014]
MPRNPTASRALGAEALTVGAIGTWAREAESEAANDAAMVTGAAAVEAAEEAEAVARAALTAAAEYLIAHRG